MPKLVISSHNLKSRALKDLAQSLSTELGYKVYRVKPERIRRRKAILFNQGLDKITQLTRFKNNSVNCPDFATSLEAAKNMDCKNVVVRRLINSSEGKGITICKKEDLVDHAPLYTAYVPKLKEFRVHVFDNKVIDIQQKKLKNGVENKEFKVRNTANGYVFCRGDIHYDECIKSLAVDAVKALGFSQGAVDIIYNEKQNKYLVLEVNSRPGLQGTTLSIYTKAILEYTNAR